MKQSQKLRLIGFVLIFLTLFSLLPHRLHTCDENRNTPKGQEFLAEAPGSLDGVFIGSSYVYSFFEPPLAWEDQGIAVYNYTASGLPAAAMQYVMADCRKTQPDALYIIEIKTLLNFPKAADLHYLFDYMPKSTNKLLAMHACARYAGLTAGEELELYVPLFLFHSNWEAVYDNRDGSAWGLKGAGNYPMFWERYPMTEGLQPDAESLTEAQLSTLEKLLDYCDESGANVLFVATPSFVLSENYLGQVDTLGQMITDRGYSFLNCLKPDAGPEMDPEIDYYNPGHTNIGGAAKFTDFFSAWLAEEYGFADKRGQPGWESWDSSVGQYKDVIWEFLPERYGPPPPKPEA